MGIYSEYQPIYAAKGILTFPMNDKRPAVKGYQKVTASASASYVAKFSDANAMAFLAGPESKITVIDIDSADQALWTDTIDRHGDTPIKVGTPSGGLHLWYLNAGEPRKIKEDGDLPIDLLGSGVVVAPPSVSSKGTYRFLQGGLDDLQKLKPAANVNWPAKAVGLEAHLGRIAVNQSKARESRNSSLFRFLMQQAAHLDDLSDLEPIAWDFVANQIDRNAGHSFTDAEVRATINSVKKITLEGRNRFGGRPHSIMLNVTRDALHELGPDALFLYSFLQRMNADQDHFLIANALCLHMPDGAWARKRFTAARSTLEEAGLIVMVKPATRLEPALYRWP